MLLNPLCWVCQPDDRCEADTIWHCGSQSLKLLPLNCGRISGEILPFFKIFYLFFLERVREGEREGEKHQCVVASCTPPTGDLAYNPGMCSDWESNWQPFGSQPGAQATEAHQPGHILAF